MPFKPGESGNPSGAKPEKPFTDAIRRAINQSDGKVLRRIAEQILERAMAGESWAIMHVADRLEGKPAQRIEQTGEGGGPLILQILTGVPQTEQDITPELEQTEQPLLPAELPADRVEQG